jgi:protein-S-isoprenylcysteine O-methyltransferase Ste14
MSLADFVYSVVVGPRQRRLLLTTVAFSLFCAVLIVLTLGAIRLDAWLGIGPLRVGRAGGVVGWLLLGSGALLCSWCITLFRFAKGTPVPFSPPTRLLARGPYAHTRNPMLTGLFATLLGAGLVLESPSLVLGLTPLLVLGATLELKLIEEPELQRRFGASYTEYKSHVPMFVPRPAGWRGAD